MARTEPFANVIEKDIISSHLSGELPTLPRNPIRPAVGAVIRVGGHDAKIDLNRAIGQLARYPISQQPYQVAFLPFEHAMQVLPRQDSR